MKKFFIFCNLIQKSKLSYILDSLHTNWNISRVFCLFFCFVCFNSDGYDLGKLKIQYLKKFEYSILSLISLINFEYK